MVSLGGGGGGGVRWFTKPRKEVQWSVHAIRAIHDPSLATPFNPRSPGWKISNPIGIYFRYLGRRLAELAVISIKDTSVLFPFPHVSLSLLLRSD